MIAKQRKILENDLVNEIKIKKQDFTNYLNQISSSHNQKARKFLLMQRWYKTLICLYWIKKSLNKMKRKIKERLRWRDTNKLERI